MEPSTINKHLIIRQDDDGQLVIDVLMDGYNIIEETVYDAHELAKALLDHINNNK